MVQWTEQQLREYCERQRHRDRRQELPPAQPQLPLCSGSLETKGSKEVHRQKYAVIVTDYRTRLCDDDNLCAKFHIDWLRHAGLLPNDCPQIARLVVRQALAEKAEGTKTVIRIIQYDPESPEDLAQVWREIQPLPL